MASTIKDVAKRAGVSISMVSKVLNDANYGTDGTRKKILTASRELHYRPHAIARSLARKKSNTLGLVLPDLTNPIFIKFAQIVESEVRKFGYKLLLCNTDKSVAAEANYIDMLLSKSVDGMIFFSVLNKDDIIKLKKFDVKVVIVERPDNVPDVDLFLVDNVKGGYDATRHLIELGHKKIGLLIGDLRGQIESNRFKGYKKALNEAGLEVADKFIRCAGYEIDDSRKAALDLLEQSERPTAIFAACDIMALSTIRAAETLGISLPEELSIIGYDDTLSNFTSPMVSTIAQPLREIGEDAVSTLINRIKSKNTPFYKKSVFNPKLIVRQSTVRNTKN